MTGARDLDFSSVATFIAELEANSRAFLGQAQELAAALHTRTCKARVGLAQGTIRALVVGSSLVAVGGLLLALTPAFRKKPKFN
jgi:hypothetical protein